MKPFFEHDCDRCVYIGSGTYFGTTVDVYEACDASFCTHILRFGIDSDYVTTNTSQEEVDFQLITDKEQELIDRFKIMLNDARQERETLRTRLSSLDHEIESFENKLAFWLVADGTLQPPAKRTLGELLTRE